MFPDEFWIQVAPDNTFECPYCKGIVTFDDAWVRCPDCETDFFKDDAPVFRTDVPPPFRLEKVWCSKSEWVLWMEAVEVEHKIMNEILKKRGDKK
jgi:uncharacterized Zn-finger protein